MEDTPVAGAGQVRAENGKTSIPDFSSGTAGEIAARFLEWLDPVGAHNLSAFDPLHDGRPPVANKTFQPKRFAEIAAWVDQHAGKLNLYYTSNRVRSDFGDERTRKEVIAAIRGLWIDIDPLPGHELETVRERIRSWFEERKGSFSAVLDSGGGFQGLILFPNPIEKTEANKVWAESYAKGLIASVDIDGAKADDTHEISHLFRLPGPDNIPTPKKIEKGRVVRPANVVHVNPKRFSEAQIEGSIRPKLVTSGADSEEIEKARSSLEYSGYECAGSYSELDPELRTRFESDLSSDPRLAALWHKGELVGGDKRGADKSGSAYRFALAGRLKRTGRYSVEDYACLAWVWDFAVQLGDDRDSKLTPRALARDWAKSSNEIQPEDHFQPPTDAAEINRQIAEHTASVGEGPASATPTRRAKFFKATSLAGKPIPSREWIVPDLVPANTVTILSGDGGTGKSLLALQLAVSITLGTEWVGRPVKRGSAVFLSAEDDRNELHRRLADVVRAEGRVLSDLGDLTLSSMAGEDALLATLSQGRVGVLHETPLFAEIDAHLQDIQPELIVLDTSADLFGGDEINRAQVRQFIGMLRKRAIEHRCAVLLLSHPSLTGMNSGSGTSGSTAWSNSVRARLYLERASSGKTEADPNLRVLSSKKSNYGPVGIEITLAWQGGVFVSRYASSADRKSEIESNAERVFLKLLDKYERRGDPLNSASGSKYAPTVFKDDPDNEDLTRATLIAAMRRLLAAGVIVNLEVGPNSKRTKRLARAETDFTSPPSAVHLGVPAPVHLPANSGTSTPHTSPLIPLGEVNPASSGDLPVRVFPSEFGAFG